MGCIHRSIDRSIEMPSQNVLEEQGRETEEADDLGQALQLRLRRQPRPRADVAGGASINGLISFNQRRWGLRSIYHRVIETSLHVPDQEAHGHHGQRREELPQQRVGRHARPGPQRQPTGAIPKRHARQSIDRFDRDRCAARPARSSCADRVIERCWWLVSVDPIGPVEWCLNRSSSRRRRVLASARSRRGGQVAVEMRR